MRAFRPVLILAGLVLVGQVLERRGLQPFGTLAGLPYDLRVPTLQRVRERLWDPDNPQVITPTVFGLGFGVNFGAVARRLGLL